MHVLRDGERSVGEIAILVGVSQPAATEHLHILREAGLVVERRDGTRRMYRAHDEGLTAVLAQLEDLWGTSLRRLADRARDRKRR